MEEKVTKVCKDCGRELCISDFPSNNHMSDGHLNTCRKCTAERIKKSRDKKRMQSGENLIENPCKAQRGTKATLRLSDFTDTMLFAELRRRGYEGELKYAKIINI